MKQTNRERGIEKQKKEVDRQKERLCQKEGNKEKDE